MLMPSPDDLQVNGPDALEIVHRIGSDVVALAADDVDREARFPSEGIDALRDAGMLGALVPEHLGGLGLTYTDVAALCRALGRYCANTAMVFAMHQIQVACIVEHGQGVPHFDAVLTEIARSGTLIASATSENGIGGDVRSSICAVEQDGDQFSLIKEAIVISYGSHVRDVLVTARRNAQAAANDQVIVHVQTPTLTLEQRSDWDTLGMRGTCSVGFLLTATGSIDQILPTPYAEVSSMTMLPVSHITWASLWLGIAEHAVDKARMYVRSAARKTPGTLPPSARRLADTYASLEQIRSVIDDAVAEYERARNDLDLHTSLRFAIRMNNLKVSASQDVLAVVQSCLLIVGMAGYRNDSPYSLGRQLRDAYSAVLMVHNDRVLDHNASLLCVMKGS